MARMRLLPAGLVAAALAATFAFACQSFSSDEVTSPGGDGGATNDAEAGNDDGAASGGEAPDAAVPSCADLQPVIVADGGEDPHCGAGGTEVVLGSSTLNCGSCGHACAGSLPCVNGMCALPDVATPHRGSNVISGGTAVGLFVSSNDPSCALDGGSDLAHLAGTALGTVASAVGECFGHAEVVDGQLFLASTKGIRQGPAGAFTGGTVVPGTVPTGTVTATRKTLFWVIGSNPTLWFLSRGTSMPVQLSSATNYIPHRIAADADAAYWVVNDQPAPAGANLYRRADTGNVEKLFAGLPTTVSIALDRDFIYLGAVDGQILRAPKSGAAAGAVAPVAAIVGARPNLVGLAVDDAWVYAIGSEAAFPSDKAVDVWRAPKCGGRASKIGFFSQATVDRLVDLGDRLALPNVGSNGAVHFLGK